MDRSQTARVLTKIAAFDRRTLGEEDVLIWHEALEDLDYATALAAVTSYYRDSRQWVMPSDIREHCTQVTTERIRQATRVNIAPSGTTWWGGTSRDSFKIIQHAEGAAGATDYRERAQQDAHDYTEIKRRIGSGEWDGLDYTAYLEAGLVLAEYDQRKAITS